MSGIVPLSRFASSSSPSSIIQHHARPQNAAPNLISNLEPLYLQARKVYFAAKQDLEIKQEEINLLRVDLERERHYYEKLRDQLENARNTLHSDNMAGIAPIIATPTITPAKTSFNPDDEVHQRAALDYFQTKIVDSQSYSQTCSILQDHFSLQSSFLHVENTSRIIYLLQCGLKQAQINGKSEEMKLVFQIIVRQTCSMDPELTRFLEQFKPYLKDSYPCIENAIPFTQSAEIAAAISPMPSSRNVVSPIHAPFGDTHQHSTLQTRSPSQNIQAVKTTVTNNKAVIEKNSASMASNSAVILEELEDNDFSFTDEMHTAGPRNPSPALLDPDNIPAIAFPIMTEPSGKATLTMDVRSPSVNIAVPKNNDAFVPSLTLVAPEASLYTESSTNISSTPISQSKDTCVSNISEPLHILQHIKTIYSLEDVTSLLTYDIQDLRAKYLSQYPARFTILAIYVPCPAINNYLIYTEDFKVNGRVVHITYDPTLPQIKDYQLIGYYDLTVPPSEHKVELLFDGSSSISSREHMVGNILVVERVNFEGLVSNIESDDKFHIAQFKTIAKIDESIRSKQELPSKSGIILPWIDISLIDKVTLKRMKIPARGRNCTHIDCFDLRSWVYRHHKSNLCPLCGRTITIGLPTTNSVCIDLFVVKLLQTASTSDDCSSIRVYRGGNFFLSQDPGLIVGNALIGAERMISETSQSVQSPKKRLKIAQAAAPKDVVLIIGDCFDDSDDD